MNLNNWTFYKHTLRFFFNILICVYFCDKHGRCKFYYISFHRNKILYNQLKNWNEAIDSLCWQYIANKLLRYWEITDYKPTRTVTSLTFYDHKQNSGALGLQEVDLKTRDRNDPKKLHHLLSDSSIFVLTNVTRTKKKHTGRIKKPNNF